MTSSGPRPDGGLQPRRLGLFAAVVALALVMLAVATLQWRQYEVLEISLGRLETEQAQLTEDLQRMVAEPNATTAASVQQRTASLLERTAGRGVELRRQNLLSIALTVLQIALLAALAALIWRQVRSQRGRRRSLETLADNLSAARHDAEAANRAKSVFLANMSHEIRTPFHGMLGMMSLLQDSRLSPQQTIYLDTARESAHHLLTILNDILDISQLESGKLQVVPQTVDLLQLLNQVDALMRAQAIAKSLLLRIDLAPDVPRWVRADPTRVRQILFNLLSNALKFTAVGEVVLAVRNAVDGRIEFRVTDSGIGMDPTTQARLFQRFMQGDERPSRRTSGTGLGLQISRDLARLMNGDITVQSELGRGSVFTVSLPLVSVAAPTRDADNGAHHGSHPMPSLRVLVAEDHAVNRAYLEAVLEKLGHHGVFVGDGHGAVQAVQGQTEDAPFDIVLMDLHMPDMDGFTAARTIRAMPGPHGRVPIVALTADAFQTSRELAREAGMEGFLTKPAHLPQLRDALQRYASGATAPTLDSDADTRTVMPNALLDFATVADISQSLSGPRYAELLERFFGERNTTLAALHSAVETGEPQDLRSQAHSLKGAASVLGLHAIAALALALQDEAASAGPETLASCTDHIHQLADLFEASRAEAYSAGLLKPPTAPVRA